MPEDVKEQDQQTTETEVTETETAESEKKPESQMDWRTKQAIELLEALENPETAPIVVKAMAEKLGLTAAEKAQVQKAQSASTIKEIVKSKLGDSGAFIANELGEALEEIITTYQQNVQKTIMEIEQQRAAREFQKEYMQAVEELNISEEEADALAKLADEYPWNGKTPIKKYLSGLLNITRSEAAKQDKRAANFEKRAKTVSASADEFNIKQPQKFASPREAVEFALKQLQKG